MSEQPVVSERLAYRVKEAAALVGLSETMMRELLLRGEIASKKVGKARLVPRWALEEWLEQSEPAAERAAWHFQDR